MVFFCLHYTPDGDILRVRVTLLSLVGRTSPLARRTMIHRHTHTYTYAINMLVCRRIFMFTHRTFSVLCARALCAVARTRRRTVDDRSPRIDPCTKKFPMHATRTQSGRRRRKQNGISAFITSVCVYTRVRARASDRDDELCYCCVDAAAAAREPLSDGTRQNYQFHFENAACCDDCARHTVCRLPRPALV